MAEKFSLKTIIIISLLCGILSACMSPIDIQVFIETPEVQQVIAATDVTVKIDPSSDDYINLIAGYGKISGLNPDKYYMVEQEIDDATGNPKGGYPKFVTEFPGLTPGQLFATLEKITKIKNRTITTLINKNTYTVKFAKYLTAASVPYTNNGVGGSADVSTAGVITVSNPKGSIILDLSGEFYGTYDVMAVANPSTPTVWGDNKQTISSWNAFSTLEGPDTTVDYVFFQAGSPNIFKVLTVKIEPVVIYIPEISGVTPPAYGETPVTKINDTVQYTGTVSWLPSPSGTFAASTVYTARITLTAKKGYTLTGVGANFFTVDGTSSAATNAANSGVITAVFPATGEAPLTVITPGAISGVTPPVTGFEPVTSITSTTQYTGTVSWSPDPFTLSGGKFAASTEYTATITLTPKTGYTLTGVGANSFTVAGTSIPATNAANSGVITAVFPATGAAGGVNVTITFTIGDKVGSSSSASITIGATKPNDNLNLTAVGGSLSNIKWYYNGTVIPGQTTSILNLTNASSNNYLIIGTHIFTATADVNGIPYSANFTLTVTE